ncbi:MAG TPA: hypothetical protein VEP90_03955 [Methylomirabilota bacterium]|nr:hypothetical protein [Methylomirabilota bacterium]
MEIAKELVRTKSFWVFIVVAVLGAIETIHPLPLLGLVIAALTIFGISIQGAETVLAQKDIERKHTKVLQEIEQARGEAAKQYDEATQEIKKAKEEALFLIKWVPRLWIFIYSVADKFVTPTVLKWIGRPTSKE